MRIVQLVCSPAFAGVERYVLTTSQGLAGTEEVTVIGGDPSVFPSALDGRAAWLPGGTRAEAWRSLRRLGRVDVIGTHMTDADIVGALARPRGARVVSTRHFAARRGADRPARAVARAAARRIDAQIAISRFVAENTEPPSVVVHTGVADAPREPAHGREPVVLVVQRLESEKNTAEALRIWAASDGPSSGWRLKIGGQGGERGALERLADTLGVAASVDFLGFVADPAALYRRASVLVAPTPREGLGLVVLEAMAHGLPVVAAGAGGHLETVGGVPDAALYPPGDLDAARGLVDGLLADASRRAAYGDALRDRQRAAFTLSGQVAATLDVYRRVA